MMKSLTICHQININSLCSMRKSFALKYKVFVYKENNQMYCKTAWILIAITTF